MQIKECWDIGGPEASNSQEQRLKTGILSSSFLTSRSHSWERINICHFELPSWAHTKQCLCMVLSIQGIWYSWVYEFKTRLGSIPRCWEHSRKVFQPTNLQRNQEGKACGVVFPMRKTCPSIWKAGTWNCLIAWWSVSSVVSSNIKHLQPGLEVARNLNDPSCQGPPKLSQPVSEIPNRINDPYISCITRGSPKLP